jgi:hypothetical protein
LNETTSPQAAQKGANSPPMSPASTTKKLRIEPVVEDTTASNQTEEQKEIVIREEENEDTTDNLAQTPIKPVATVPITTPLPPPKETQTQEDVTPPVSPHESTVSPSTEATSPKTPTTAKSPTTPKKTSPMYGAGASTPTAFLTGKRTSRKALTDEVCFSLLLVC